jgi:hypothetical protein
MGWGHPQNRVAFGRAEVLTAICGNRWSHTLRPSAKLSGQVLCNCRSACGEDRAFEDDGEAVSWFEPLDRRE